MVDCLQTDSSGPHEASDPLQLTLSHVVLENNVIWEVDTADGFKGILCLAAVWDVTAL